MIDYYDYVYVYIEVWILCNPWSNFFRIFFLKTFFFELISNTLLYQLFFSTFVESGKLFFSQCFINKYLEYSCLRVDQTLSINLFRKFQNLNWPFFCAIEIVCLHYGRVSV